MDNGFSLALAFDSDAPEFTRGVEVGRLWEMLKDPDGFEQAIHAENVEMVMRMAEATGRRMRVEEMSEEGRAVEEWVELVVEPA